MRAMRLLSRCTLPVALAAALGAAACGSRMGDSAAPASTAPAATGQTPQPDKPVAAAPPAETPAPPAAPFEISSEPRGYTGELPPLPTPAFATARPPEIVKAVFTFAARHPEVLHYVPCFCGCESRGHRGNDDCFISGRDLNGRPRWEEHGMG